jgi:hypothetical protein
MRANPNVNAAWFAQVPISVPAGHPTGQLNAQDRAEIRPFIDGIVKGAGNYIKGDHQP